MAYPVVNGIVCFSKDVDLLLNAVHEVQEAILADKTKKRKARVFKNWSHLVNKLVNRERLFAEYL